MEEPTNVVRITASLLLLRVNPFTISNSYFYFITVQHHHPKSSLSLALAGPLRIQEENKTSTVSTTSSLENPEQDVLLLRNAFSSNHWDITKNTLLHSESSLNNNQLIVGAETKAKSTKTIKVPSLSKSTLVFNDYFCTLLLLLVLRQVTQACYFQKHLQNNSSEDLNFNCNCT